jgi:hypothetical protein
MVAVNIFNASAYLLYKNPILFLLPSIGSVISIVSEASFVVGLHNNNNQNYLPFSDIFVLFLFFISFTIGYFQLVFIARKAVFEMIFENKNYYNLIIFELLIIYSFYALTLADIGGYESDMRSSLASVNTDRLFVIIISFGIPLVLLLTIISMFFNAWMVQYILLITADQKNISSSIPGLYQSLSKIVIIGIHSNLHPVFINQ